ncbi:MAG: alpha-galactosidase [Candidatus Aminicenantes bacterium]|nr:alpha-galactosidase [Candidatus Aminicenantes bacterium]
MIPFFLATAAVSCSESRPNASDSAPADWLIDPSPYAAMIETRADGRDLILTNGLIERRLRFSPDAATVEYRNLRTGEGILRAVRPEAVLELDGKRYPVGGLLGQPDQAYLLETWIAALTPDPSAFHYRSHRTGEIESRLPYVRKHWAEERPWPPKGKALAIDFGRDDLPGILITVHYEIYDGLPLLAKWVSLKNDGPRPVRLNAFVSEILAVVESGITADERNSWARPNLHIESDYAYLGSSPKSANRAAFWIADPTFTTQVDYGLNTPCLLECRPPIGPDVDIAPGSTFETFRTWELIYDSFDRERKGLSLRRMYRTIAPWATENPIFLHLKSTDPAVVREAVDQCAVAGFEMIILSFGSGLDMENTDPAYLDRMKALADYAHSRGIRLGGYSLLASRSIGPVVDVINPATGKPGGFAAFGNSPCLGSRWGIAYFAKLRAFFERTGFDILEHDGSYPGDVCASTAHPGHRGLEDSQWTQMRTITDFYKWCRERGIYLNVPDWYFLSGATKTAVGYREVNWSLPRDRQIILGRQNLFDGTWEKTPSMGWTFVPLVQYHGGGEAATLEPLSEHLDAYKAHLVQNFGYGVQACYRGTRLFDTDETKALVVTWVDWYKKYRDILNSDVIHLRRPDGRHLDAILHVNPGLKEKGFLLVFNPTDADIGETLSVPLYYTGLADSAHVREGEGPSQAYRLDKEAKVLLPVRIPARGFSWYVIK